MHSMVQVGEGNSPEPCERSKTAIRFKGSCLARCQTEPLPEGCNGRT